MKSIQLVILSAVVVVLSSMSLNANASERKHYRQYQNHHNHRVERRVHREHYRRQVVRESYRNHRHYRHHHYRGYREPVIINYYNDYDDYYSYPRYRSRYYYGPGVNVGYYGHIKRNTAEVLAAGLIIGTILDLDD